MDPAQKADMRAYMSLANNILGNAEVKLSYFLFFTSFYHWILFLTIALYQLVWPYCFKWSHYSSVWISVFLAFEHYSYLEKEKECHQKTHSTWLDVQIARRGVWWCRSLLQCPQWTPGQPSLLLQRSMYWVGCSRFRPRLHTADDTDAWQSVGFHSAFLP